MTDRHEALVAALADATAANRPLPPFGAQLDLDAALDVQHRLTRQRSPEGPGGIKLGLTDPGAQATFGLDGPLLASLYPGGRLRSGARIDYLQGRLIECELGLVIDASGAIVAAFPALELVYVNFEDRSELNAPNLVASNLGADLFVVGERRGVDALEGPIEVNLASGDDLLNTAEISASLEEQTRTARWVQEEALTRGFDLGDETIVLMGTRGKPVPCERGHYVADYGAFGSVTFEVI